MLINVANCARYIGLFLDEGEGENGFNQRITLECEVHIHPLKKEVDFTGPKVTWLLMKPRVCAWSCNSL